MKLSLSPELADIAAIMAHNFREARHVRDWTQAEVAERLQISRVTLKRMESGDPGVGMGSYLRLLDLYGMADHMAQLAAPHTDHEGIRLRNMSFTRASRRNG